MDRQTMIIAGDVRTVQGVGNKRISAANLSGVEVIAWQIRRYAAHAEGAIEQHAARRGIPCA
ncbi:hypothetical protein D3C78_1082200 [compost metagenome]